MLDTKANPVSEKILCAHCGDVCDSKDLMYDAHHFCCNGCKMVYQMLGDADLGEYYNIDNSPGKSQKDVVLEGFEYLEEADIVRKLLEFKDGSKSRITFELPQIHCSACLWLLENIDKLDAGITHSRVNFAKKKLSLTFDHEATTLKEIVKLLTKIGYRPTINYDSISETRHKATVDRTLLYKLGLAGFSFGNVMLLSFPEYLGFEKASYLFYIGYINIMLALPVLIYSGVSYIKSAWNSIVIKQPNIDVPIAIGMITLFSRSVFEILSQSGEGYLDSFTGFVFFLLIGRWFQEFTYMSLDFERNYKAYFPISATVSYEGLWISKSLDLLMPGDLIRIKNQELVPCDAILEKGKARIDYSFVTGEADLVTKSKGDSIFAGGRHQGESIEVIVTKKVDQSYLTQLWNEDTFNNKEVTNTSKLVNLVSKYFTYCILVIALLTMLYWWQMDQSKVFDTFSAVLIVACPCALALAIPFTYGNILRILSTRGFYLRNVNTIEEIQDVDHVIFDKTGTITDSKLIKINYEGRPLSAKEMTVLKSSCLHSSHPLSKAIVRYMPEVTEIDIDSYRDIIGSGFVATVDEIEVRVGSSSFIFGTEALQREQGVFIEFNGEYIGYFKFEHALRDNIELLIQKLKKDYKLILLSGDTERDEERMTRLFGEGVELCFNKAPKDKLQKIKELQLQGNKVMMIGDGLNDAGALKQADVGIVISDETNNFSPACDGIVDARKFRSLLEFFIHMKKARLIIIGAFVFAFIYNTIGLYFATTGNMSPVVAAILMPLSSISVILYGVIASWLLLRKAYGGDLNKS